MHSRRLIGVLLAAIFLVGCDPTTIHHSPSYAPPARPPRVSCAVAFFGEIQVDYSGDVENEFGPGDKVQLIRQFVKKQLTSEIARQNRINTVWVAAPTNDYRRRQASLAVRTKGEVGFQLPVEGEALEFEGETPTLVLLLGSVSVMSNWEGYISRESSGLETIITTGTGRSNPPFTPVPGPGKLPFVSSKDLVISARFALWDNISRSLISYGYVQAVDENTFAVSMEDWLAALGTFTEKIFSGTYESAGWF